MNSKLVPRLAGVLAVNGIIAGIFWAIVKFGLAKESGLSQQVLGLTEGDPVRIQSYLEEMTGGLLVPGVIGIVLGAALAVIWLILVDRNPPYGDQSAKAKRGSWAGLLLFGAAVTFGLFWWRVIAAPLSELAAPSIPVTVTGLGEILMVLGFWLSTAIFVPSSTKIAVPGAGLLGG